VSSKKPQPEESREAERQRVGLCADCIHVRKIESDRSSIFYFCQRSRTEPEFPKYPRLPVLQCRGYEEKA
jgi:hypothetical protein